MPHDGAKKKRASLRSGLTRKQRQEKLAMAERLVLSKRALTLAEDGRWAEVAAHLRAAVVDKYLLRPLTRTVLLAKAVVANELEVVKAALTCGADPNLILDSANNPIYEDKINMFAMNSVTLAVYRQCVQTDVLAVLFKSGGASPWLPYMQHFLHALRVQKCDS